MTSGVESIEIKCTMMMNPSYPWTIRVLSERSCCTENAVRLALKRMEADDLVEKYFPNNEMTHKIGNKWRLTKKGLDKREEFLGVKNEQEIS